MDLTLGAILSVLALPAILVLAIGVALTLRTNPFFVQRRVGRGGRLIPILKLRTLPRSAPRFATKYELEDVRIPAFTLRLRQMHLDELPQLLLVPLGYLSLVGPRPEMPTMHAQADPGFASERVQIRPGCTGLWQISEANSGLIWESPEYDRYYVRNCSVVLDLQILWRTAIVMTGLGEPFSLESLRPAVAPARARVELAA
jgi:lipopolysaccharide/colanic/teichoic acid biosynthesis glycosyltransferase